MKDELEQLLAPPLRKVAAPVRRGDSTRQAEVLPPGSLEPLRAPSGGHQNAAAASALAARGGYRDLPSSARGVDQRQIRTFAELEFIPKAENIVFIGPTGVGKTGLASGLLLKALQNGHRGIFMRAQDLFDEMYASLADRSTRRLLNRLAKVDVLVVDEMGYLNLRPEQTNIFFKLMEERYRQRPTIITTNLDHRVQSGNKVLVDALLSRLRHQCHTVKIDGPGLRDPTG
jgi:DNA replication protein DnaC